MASTAGRGATEEETEMNPEPIKALIVRWREESGSAGRECARYETLDQRNRADRHYQRSLELAKCVNQLEKVLNEAEQPFGERWRKCTLCGRRFNRHDPDCEGDLPF